MADPVDVILQFHDTASFGTHENMLARSREVNEAYGSLTERQVAEVVSITRRTAVVRIDVSNLDRLVAIGQGTVLITRPRTPEPERDAR